MSFYLERLAANDRRPRPLQCEDQDAGSRQQTEYIVPHPVNTLCSSVREESVTVRDDFAFEKVGGSTRDAIHIKALLCTVWWSKVFASLALVWPFEKQAHDPNRRIPCIWLFPGA